jgi:hypothetical protein
LEGLLKSSEFIQRQLAHFAGGKENEVGQTKQIGSCAAPGSAQNAVHVVAIFHSFSQFFFYIVSRMLTHRFSKHFFFGFISCVKETCHIPENTTHMNVATELQKYTRMCQITETFSFLLGNSRKFPLTIWFRLLVTGFEHPIHANGNISPLV